VCCRWSLSRERSRCSRNTNCIFVCATAGLALRTLVDSAAADSGLYDPLSVMLFNGRMPACDQVAVYASSQVCDALRVRLLSVVMYIRHVVTGGSASSPFVPQRSSPTEQPSPVAVERPSAFDAG